MTACVQLTSMKQTIGSHADGASKIVDAAKPVAPTTSIQLLNLQMWRRMTRNLKG